MSSIQVLSSSIGNIYTSVFVISYGWNVVLLCPGVVALLFAIVPEKVININDD